MYCSINFSKKITDEEFRILENRFNDLNNFYYKSLHHYPRTSVLVHNHKNFEFRLTKYKLTGAGSLTKLHLGNNIENIGFEQIIAELTQLETVLNIDLNDAIVTRLDVGATIKVETVPSDYLKRMIAPIGFKTSMENDFETLYFKSTIMDYCIYDKNLEALKKREYKALAQSGEYKLRYEIQIKKLAKFLSLPIVRWPNLYNRDLYERLVKEWHEKFHAITFKDEGIEELPHFNTLKGFKEFLYLIGIETCGGLAEALKLTKKSIANKSERSKMKKWILSIKTAVQNKEKFSLNLKEKVREFYQTNYVHCSQNYSLIT